MLLSHFANDGNEGDDSNRDANDERQNAKPYFDCGKRGNGGRGCSSRDTKDTLNCSCAHLSKRERHLSCREISR